MHNSFNFVEASLELIKEDLNRMKSLLSEYYIPKIAQLEQKNKEIQDELNMWKTLYRTNVRPDTKMMESQNIKDEDK